MKLNSDNIPESLRALIPLAERWGISDDVERIELIEELKLQIVPSLK